MPIYQLTDDLIFPPVTEAEDGILAVGGDLTPERLILAYKSGIFPWYSNGQPIIWWSPDPRFILYPDDLKISKSLQQLMRNHSYGISENKDFEAVIDHCKKIPRKGQESTWITDEMKMGYIRLHELGLAKSIEVWKGDELVGGFYGVDMGNVFCGESMFAKVSNTSKLAFVTFVMKFKKNGGKLIDCQTYTDHLASLGAVEIDRVEFLQHLI